MSRFRITSSDGTRYLAALHPYNPASWSRIDSKDPILMFDSREQAQAQLDELGWRDCKIVGPFDPYGQLVTGKWVYETDRFGREVSRHREHAPQIQEWPREEDGAWGPWPPNSPANVARTGGDGLGEQEDE